MRTTFDLYAPGESWLYRLDPRVKLLGVGVGSLAAFLLAGVGRQLLLLVGIISLLRGGRVPRHRLAWLWGQMRVLVGIILVLQPLFTVQGDVLLGLGPLRWTVGGLAYAATLALRTLSIAYLVGGLLFTTDQRRLVQAMVRLGMPYTWGLTVSLTLRFLPTIQSLFAAIREAQAARGWVAEGNLFRRARSYFPVLVAVIIATLRTGDQLTLALAARGLGREQGPRTVWRPLRMRPHDWAATAILLVIGAALLLARFVGVG